MPMLSDQELLRADWKEACEVLDLPLPKVLTVDQAPRFLSEAKKAYRKQAHATHPDRGGDEESFKIVQEAWETIQNGCQNISAWGLDQQGFRPFGWTPQAWSAPAASPSAGFGAPPPWRGRQQPFPSSSKRPPPTPKPTRPSPGPFSHPVGNLVLKTASGAIVPLPQGTPLQSSRFNFGNAGVVSTIQIRVSSHVVDGALKAVLHVLFVEPIPHEAVDTAARVQVTASMRNLSFTIRGTPVGWTWGSRRELTSVILDVL